jgi:hypothetical protein
MFPCKKSATEKITGDLVLEVKNFGKELFSGLEEIRQNVDCWNLLTTDSLSSSGNPVLSSETGTL